MKYMIAAYDNNRVIGNHGQMPWEGKMPADMRHFRTITRGQAVIMGRITLEAIGTALPGRQNIVISRHDFRAENVTTVHSLEDAYAAVESDRDAFVIGGAQIYEQALETTDVIYATEIDASFEGDAFFPVLASEWHETAREDYLADEKNGYDYSFITYSK